MRTAPQGYRGTVSASGQADGGRDGQRPPSQPKEYLEPVPLVRVRRRPNFLRFMLTGAMLGLVSGYLVDQLGTDAARYGPLTSFAFFGLGFAALGALLGALVAVLLDRR